MTEFNKRKISGVPLKISYVPLQGYAYPRLGTADLDYHTDCYNLNFDIVEYFVKNIVIALIHSLLTL
jgi:hypothetical protein